MAICDPYVNLCVSRQSYKPDIRINTRGITTMISKTFKLLLGASLLVALSPSVFAQRPTTATHIPRAEIMTVFEHMGETIDQQIRVVDIGDEVNVAVGILQRIGTRTEGEAVNAILHHRVTSPLQCDQGAPWAKPMQLQEQLYSIWI